MNTYMYDSSLKVVNVGEQIYSLTELTCPVAARGVYSSLFGYIHTYKKTAIFSRFYKKLGPFYKKLNPE